MKDVTYFILYCCLSLMFGCQPNSSDLFRAVPVAHTNVLFSNPLIESDSTNVLSFTNMYTGSGVAIADFDNDGLQDIFFGGNMSSSKLYLNKGSLKFEDKTKACGVETDRWVTGVSTIDINRDGWQDLYLSVSGFSKDNRRNYFFINKGLVDGDLKFEDAAERMGLDIEAQITNSVFFDYDLDGDEDVFMIVNPSDYDLSNVNTIRTPKMDGTSKSTDMFFENLGDGTFKNVSTKSGILCEGYSLGVGLMDINFDGYIDMYVANDFLTSDIIYVNQGNGTFKNEINERTAHTSFASMGLDIADIDEDGDDDIYTLDMLPEDHFRYNMIITGANDDRHHYMLKAGYHPQYARNNLQLNDGRGRFSEIGQFSKVHNTDWSWSALFADFDNDSDLDLHVTNGFYRDMGNLDFINYVNSTTFGDPQSLRKRHLEAIHNLPNTFLKNYLFFKNDDLVYENRQDLLNCDLSASTGASFGDLDNDGDLDLVVSNVGQEAYILENVSQENHSLRVDFSRSRIGNVGARVELYSNEKVYKRTFSPYRGYLSSSEPVVHFGLGETMVVDSILIKWNTGERQILATSDLDRTIFAKPSEKTGIKKPEFKTLEFPKKKMFLATELNVGVEFVENISSDFRSQPLLPHQYSSKGPITMTLDINEDGLEDIIIGTPIGQHSFLLLQKENGKFDKSIIPYSNLFEDTDIDTFRLASSGKLAFLLSSGDKGQKTKDLKSRIYKFEDDSCKEVKIDWGDNGRGVAQSVIVDVDKDGLDDIVSFGSVKFGKYPNVYPTHCYLQGPNGFTKYLEENIFETLDIPVLDAISHDINNDGFKDILFCGEWMSPKAWIIGPNSLEEKELAKAKGWWTKIECADLDNDGDDDLILGNFGKNMKYDVTAESPLKLYQIDIDKNGSKEIIMTYMDNGEERLVQTRDKLLGQMPALKKKYISYKDFAAVTANEFFSNYSIGDFLEINETRSKVLIRNEKLDFKEYSLNDEFQFAPIQDIHVNDVTGDGVKDLLVSGNSNANELFTGPYDASSGFVAKGHGDGSFSVLDKMTTGWDLGKFPTSITTLRIEERLYYVVVHQSDSLKVFEFLSPINKIKI